MRKLRAFLYGVADGFRQPYEASVTRNVWHLIDAGGSEDDIFGAQDRGVSVGQFFRAGRDSEAARKGFPIFRATKGGE